MNVTMLTAEERELTASCPTPPCEWAVWYDIAHYATVVTHCHDENPEHRLFVPDIVLVRRPENMGFRRQYVWPWIRAVHDFARKPTDEEMRRFLRHD